MGMQLGIVTEQYLATEDHSWLGSRHGAEAPDGVTLDASTLSGIFTDGRVPSGLILQKITATGLYGPLDVTTPAADGRQLIATANIPDIRVLWMTTNLQAGGRFGQAFVNTGAPVLWHAELVSAKLPRQTGSGSAAQTGVAAAINASGRFLLV